MKNRKADPQKLKTLEEIKAYLGEEGRDVHDTLMACDCRHLFGFYRRGEILFDPVTRRYRNK